MDFDQNFEKKFAILTLNLIDFCFSRTMETLILLLGLRFQVRHRAGSHFQLAGVAVHNPAKF